MSITGRGNSCDRPSRPFLQFARVNLVVRTTYTITVMRDGEVRVHRLPLMTLALFGDGPGAPANVRPSASAAIGVPSRLPTLIAEKGIPTTHAACG